MKDNIADNPKTDIKFDTERFIAEIKRRPIIYDNASKNFHDRDLKMVAWNDVCESMIPKWDLLSHEEKQAEEQGIRLFRFPNEDKRQEIWAQGTQRGNEWKPNDSYRLCEKHFEDSHFETHCADGWRKLKPNAIPILFKHYKNFSNSIESAKIKKVKIKSLDIASNSNDEDFTNYVPSYISSVHKSLIPIPNVPNTLQDMVDNELDRLKRKSAHLKKLFEHAKNITHCLKLKNQQLHAKVEGTKTFLSEYQINILQEDGTSHWPNKTIIKEKYLKGRWRNIKDYYIKELKLQRKTNDTLGGRKRRKCDERFDQLKFLLPSIENKTSRIQLYQNGDLDQALELDNPITQEPETSQEDLYEDCVITERIEEPEMVTYRYLMSETPEEEPASMDEAEAPVSDTDEVTQLASPVADEDGSRSLEDDDYDRMFLLSLLPIMRRVPETKKLDVRIQMQQLLARAIRSRAKKK